MKVQCFGLCVCWSPSELVKIVLQRCLNPLPPPCNAFAASWNRQDVWSSNGFLFGYVNNIWHFIKIYKCRDSPFKCLRFTGESINNVTKWQYRRYCGHRPTASISTSLCNQWYRFCTYCYDDFNKNVIFGTIYCIDV